MASHIPSPFSPSVPIDTSPATLEMDSDNSDISRSRVKRLSASMENAVTKLGRSLSGKASPTKSASPRRIFSLSRSRGKGRAEEDLLSASSTPSASRPISPRDIPLPSEPQDDSPFITPPSPTLAPSRPMLSSFRGGGSMRAGTQTLIQALQALPWTDPDNEDDVMPQTLSPVDIDSDEEGKQGKFLWLCRTTPSLTPSLADRLASSIHTIYRPLARSQRLNTSQGHRRKAFPQHTTVSEEETTSDVTSEISEQEDAEDFEQSTPRPPYAEQPLPLHIRRQQQNESGVTLSPSMLRSGSMATVKLQRRVRLAEKLKQVFELDGIEEVWAEMPCWLLRSVLLQGYMYLTNSYLCFFAHMPSREDQVLKSGSLNKKAQRTKRWIKHWFVLKNDALSWYQSSSDPYFPHGIVDLRYAISCDAVNDKDFRIRTNQKSIHLSAPSVPSREEWVKAIRKVIFKAQNMGDSVKIAIPYSIILDVDKSTAMDFSETIEVKVFDKDEHFSVDSYFFAYFEDLSGALDQIRDAVRAHRGQPERASPQLLMDTTVSRSTPHPPDRAQSLPANVEHANVKASSSFSISSFLWPFHDSGNRVPTTGALAENEPFTHISRRPNSTSFVPVTSSPDTPSPSTPTPIHSQEHTYPPSSFISRSNPDHPFNSESGGNTWIGVPSWLRGTKRVFGGGGPSEVSTAMASPSSRVREVYSMPSQASRGSGLGDMAFSTLETPNVKIDPEMTEKFRTVFAYDEKETLLGYFPGYIFRLLPVPGRLYISTNFFCFKSTGPLTAKTRMTLPIRDLLAVEKTKATRFGHHGLIVIVKGHEELFFEFSAEDKRNAFVTLLEAQMEDCQRRLAQGDTSVTPGKREALILEEFEPQTQPSTSLIEATDSMTDSLPALMFTSASSTFLTFKPKRSLHFTFLTIGSRGDVQPYIALAKGLMADGHKCRIATHGEFKDWIESHGIEFGFVGGDPAELMRICIENGTFTVSFLKEGLQKFRGWLDDLLKNSWDACQGTDVLIESPSAMGGYHVAEALGIPYFRAFTMTWTRTRAYPHAFAVPERKMGGGYNYMTYVMFDQVFWRAISGQINRWRRNVLHLGSTSLDKMEPHKIPFLYNFSPQIVPPPLDWPEWIRVTGYWFLDDADVSAKKWSPPPDLVAFIDTAHAEGKKVVYIGFGSIVVSDPKTMTRCVVDAVLRSGVRAILSKGWSDRLQAKSDATEPEEPLPKEIYPIPSIPHDWLFQRIDAACHHGGAGTTGASLRAGIPTIIRPFFGDQFFWADRVEALGVGTGVRKLTVDSLTDALTSATTDIKQIDRARLIGEKIRAEDGVATAIESIYRDLDYARSLIKRDSDDDVDDEAEGEHSTIRASGYSSSGSAAGGGGSEDWSVISEHDGRRMSISSQNSDGGREPSSKRNSLAAAVLSVLPSPRRRTVSATANQAP
ncbi:Sterol 3-beta-glucosyltransferase [Mycena indigotica]|uniref:sterol 3beta-glucosyltransferase n=1 Tax=Mycena indigotica TaxID=2126181 RepID=A0A8H6SWS9_9AGAR|nr:Sterol 3-beta-glucosyltransferase [Mycena indigotica]KAF7306570.1 Sterol 3-beta-glucosyltransferase [Mycena indigotica]